MPHINFLMKTGFLILLIFLVGCKSKVLLPEPNQKFIGQHDKIQDSLAFELC